jgi:hypothetical protein
MVLFRNVSDDLVQVLHVTSLHRALMRTCFQGGNVSAFPSGRLEKVFEFLDCIEERFRDGKSFTSVNRCSRNFECFGLTSVIRVIQQLLLTQQLTRPRNDMEWYTWLYCAPKEWYVCEILLAFCWCTSTVHASRFATVILETLERRSSWFQLVPAGSRTTIRAIWSRGSSDLCKFGTLIINKP